MITLSNELLSRCEEVEEGKKNNPLRHGDAQTAKDYGLYYYCTVPANSRWDMNTNVHFTQCPVQTSRFLQLLWLYILLLTCELCFSFPFHCRSNSSSHGTFTLR